MITRLGGSSSVATRAMAASMLYVLTGLAGYVMAEQGDPGSAVDMPDALKAAREGNHLHGPKPRKTD